MSTLEDRVIKFPSRKFGGSVVPMKAIAGHFATNHSHINYYIDLTTMKARASEARQCAHALAEQYAHNTVIDTIVCLDGTDVIGAFLAEELSAQGFLSVNAHGTVYVVQPEYVSGSQLIFRDNTEPMVRNRHVLILMASVTTGVSVQKGLECIDYYGGNVVGVCALFSAVKEVNGVHINYLFDAKDVPNYTSYKRNDCPYCKKGIPIEALVNSFGYSKI